MRPPVEWVPFRWPAAWSDSTKITLLRETPFNCAAGDNIPEGVAAALRAQSIDIVPLKNAPVTVIDDSRWPQIQLGGNDANAASGPTGNPWVDSNGFAVDAARAAAPNKPVWLVETPPSKRVLRPDDFRLAVCDAATYGASWVPSLDLEAWPQIVAAQKFFAAHREWRTYRPIARLAIVSDFAGPHRDLALETINLLTRLGVSYEIVPRTRATSFVAALNIDEQKPDGDPWDLAAQTHEKLGRRNDLYRLWNATSMNARYTASPSGGTALLQLLNFTARVPGEAVTAGVTTAYRSARIYTLEQPAGSNIELHRAKDGVEVYLPPFAVYAAIEFTR